MKKVATLALLGIIITNYMFIGGCGKTQTAYKNGEDKKTENKIQESPEVKDETISTEKTNYAVYTEKNDEGDYIASYYITDKHPEVIKIKELVDGFSKSFYDIDYNTSDGMAPYKYYTDEVIENFKNMNDGPLTAKNNKDNKLIMKCEDSGVDSILINKDMNKAEVKMYGNFKCIDAVEKFFQERRIQKGVTYKQPITLHIVQVNGNWKIYDKEIVEVVQRVE